MQIRYWHHANDSKGVENARKRVNRVIRNIVSSFGGSTIRHITIRASETVCLDMTAHSLSRVVVPAKLHHTSVNA